MNTKRLTILILPLFFSLLASGQNLDLNKYDISINDTLIDKSDFIENAKSLDSTRMKHLVFKPRSDGYKKIYYLNGQLSSQGEIKNGKEEGFWTYWYDNGKKAREGNFVQGKRDGTHKYWFPDGRLRGEGGFKNDVYDGKWVMYKEDGSGSVEQTYKNGKLVKQ
jgi:antitoxin component YwqK of YwqJK toxin-antitoxin module